MKKLHLLGVGVLFAGLLILNLLHLAHYHQGTGWEIHNEGAGAYASIAAGFVITIIGIVIMVRANRHAGQRKIP